MSGNISAAIAWGFVLYYQRKMAEREGHYRTVIDTAKSALDAEDALWGTGDLPADSAPPPRKRRSNKAGLRSV